MGCCQKCSQRHPVFQPKSYLGSEGIVIRDAFASRAHIWQKLGIPLQPMFSGTLCALYHFQNTIPHECSCSSSCEHQTIFGWMFIHFCLDSQDVDGFCKHNLVFHVLKVKVKTDVADCVLWRTCCNKILTFGWLKFCVLNLIHLQLSA